MPHDFNPHQVAGLDVHVQTQSLSQCPRFDAGGLADQTERHCGSEPRSPGQFDKYTSAIPSLPLHHPVCLHRLDAPWYTLTWFGLVNKIFWRLTFEVSIGNSKNHKILIPTRLNQICIWSLLKVDEIQCCLQTPYSTAPFLTILDCGKGGLLSDSKCTHVYIYIDLLVYVCMFAWGENQPKKNTVEKLAIAHAELQQ